MREEFRQRLAKQYRYSVTKMQEEKQVAKQLFYFSMFFGEAQRILNWEWTTNVSLIHMVTKHIHTQMLTATQAGLEQLPSIDWTTVIENWVKATLDLTAYCEKTENFDSSEELCQILGRLAVISYIFSGNGSFLYEKGDIKFESST